MTLGNWRARGSSDAHSARATALFVSPVALRALTLQMSSVPCKTSMMIIITRIYTVFHAQPVNKWDSYLFLRYTASSWGEMMYWWLRNQSLCSFSAVVSWKEYPININITRLEFQLLLIKINIQTKIIAKYTILNAFYTSITYDFSGNLMVEHIGST